MRQQVKEYLGGSPWQQGCVPPPRITRASCLISEDAAIFDCLPALELSKLSLMTTVKGVLPVGAGDERVGDFNLTGDVGRTS